MVCAGASCNPGGSGRGYWCRDPSYALELNVTGVADRRAYRLIREWKRATHLNRDPDGRKKKNFALAGPRRPEAVRVLSTVLAAPRLGGHNVCQAIPLNAEPPAQTPRRQPSPVDQTTHRCSSLQDILDGRTTVMKPLGHAEREANRPPHFRAALRKTVSGLLISQENAVASCLVPGGVGAFRGGTWIPRVVGSGRRSGRGRRRRSLWSGSANLGLLRAVDETVAATARDVVVGANRTDRRLFRVVSATGDYGCATNGRPIRVRLSGSVSSTTLCSCAMTRPSRGFDRVLAVCGREPPYRGGFPTSGRPRAARARRPRAG